MKRNNYKSLQERIVSEIESTYASITAYKNRVFDKNNEHAITARRRVELFEHKLKALKMMLAKVDDGNHGWCEKCNEPILINQLVLKPTNTFCENCAN